MTDGKIIFEKDKYDGGRYLVEVGTLRGSYGTQWEYDNSYMKKSSAISRAEDLLVGGKHDRVRVIDLKA